MTGLEITVGEWLILGLLGGLVGLDAVSWPQAMWSRPIVAGTLGGAVFGGPAEGFLAGAWLELVLSRHPPFGAARYPETGPAGLTAGAALAIAGTGSLASVVAAVLVGWAIGWVGQHSVARLRHLNARLVADPSDYAGNPRDLARRHRLAIRLDGLRAALIVLALLVPSALFVRVVGAGEPGALDVAVVPALVAVGLGGLTGSGARALGAVSGRWPALVLGGLIGGVLVWGLR